MSTAGSSDPTFEQIMAELEEVTARLAAGDIGIEAAADLYERAEKLHARATERLDQVRSRVEQMTAPPEGQAPRRSGQQ
ncbi:MAG TPA: exodeoxyribonuclease VII small subunit [Acidimicrobiales bacterium]|nr:exodeoxyribonuclease VII small subunit [Acidimicrobiales bacterium]